MICFLPLQKTLRGGGDTSKFNVCKILMHVKQSKFNVCKTNLCGIVKISHIFFYLVMGGAQGKDAKEQMLGASVLEM